MEKVKLTKINTVENPVHKYGYEIGYERTGKLINEPEIDKPFYVDYFWRTSTVKEIIDSNTFRTKNSIYKWVIF